MGISGPADGRAEVHHRLDEVAGARPRHHFKRELLDSRLVGALEPMEAGDHALDVRIDPATGTPKAIAAIAAEV
jgi:gluconate kinase